MGGEILRWELSPVDDDCLLIFTDVFDTHGAPPEFREPTYLSSQEP